MRSFACRAFPAPRSRNINVTKSSSWKPAAASTNIGVFGCVWLCPRHERPPPCFLCFFPEALRRVLLLKAAANFTCQLLMPTSRELLHLPTSRVNFSRVTSGAPANLSCQLFESYFTCQILMSTFRELLHLQTSRVNFSRVTSPANFSGVLSFS